MNVCLIAEYDEYDETSMTGTPYYCLHGSEIETGSKTERQLTTTINKETKKG